MIFLFYYTIKKKEAGIFGKYCYYKYKREMSKMEGGEVDWRMS